MRWRFSNLIILRDTRELIIRRDIVYYFTRGSKVGLRKSGPETAKISRNVDPSKARGSPCFSRSYCNSCSNLPTDTLAPWLASEPQSTGDMPCLYTCICWYCAVYCNTCSTPLRCVQYSDKLPMKIACIACNCWNNSLWNHQQPNQGKQMSLGYPRTYLASDSSHHQGFWKLNPLLNYTFKFVDLDYSFIFVIFLRLWSISHTGLFNYEVVNSPVMLSYSNKFLHWFSTYNLYYYPCFTEVKAFVYMLCECPRKRKLG